MEKNVFIVKGMACEHCKLNVERSLSCLRGVVSATVNLQQQTVEVCYDAELIQPTYMKKAVDEAGYDFQI